MRNIFLEKSYTKSGEETSARPFSKIINIENISGSIVLTFVTFAFIVCQVEGNMLKLNCRPFAPT